MMMWSPFIVRLVLLIASVVAVIALVTIRGRTPTTTTTTTTNAAVLFCRIHHADALMIPDDDNHDMSTGTTTMGITECYPTTTTSSSSSSSSSSTTMMMMDNPNVPLVHEVIVTNNNDEKAESSLMERMGHSILYQYLQYQPEWVSEKKQIVIPEQVVPVIYQYDHPVIQNHLQQLPPSKEEEGNDVSHHQQQQHHHLPQHRTRHLQRVVTDQTVNKLLAVRVATADEAVVTSLDDIENHLFGTTEESFASVHSQCTLGQKNVVPYDKTTPVYDITLNGGNSSDYTFGSFFTAAEPLILELLFGSSDNGSTNNTNATNDNTTAVPITRLSDIAEYVVLIGPKGLRPTTQQPNFRFVAAGAYDSYKVVITDDWIDTPQVLQHEIGHNYNFGHPWEDGVIYGDTTSVMGQVYRNTIYNCYNGAHYHHAGWMENTTLTLDLSENATSMTAIMTDLAFYGHADRITDPEATPTLIELNGFYIMYNRATGINAETNEYANGVLLHRYKEEGVSQSGTDLLAVLELSESSGDSIDSRFYSSTEFDISIELCSRNDSGEDGDDDDDAAPDTVTLMIGTATSRVVCPDRASDVPSTSPVPTISPVPTVSLVPTQEVMASDTPTDAPVSRRRRRRR